MAGWTLESNHRHLTVDFSSLNNMLILEGKRLTHDPLSEITRIERDGVRYCVKRCRSASRGLCRHLT